MDSRLVMVTYASMVAGLLSSATADDAVAPVESAPLGSATVGDGVAISGEKFLDALASDRSDAFQFDAVVPRFRKTPDVEFKEQIEYFGWGLAELDQERTIEPLHSPTGELPVPFEIEVPPFADLTELGIVLVHPSREDERVVDRLVL